MSGRGVLAIEQSSRTEQLDDSFAFTAKPHAFGGAVLSPKHARELTPSLCLGIASALSSEFSRKNIIPYTLWITEAWRVLGWAEPSAALFWEMATMYHTLYLAGRVESEENIPPILSCGSHSSMGSATQLEQNKLNKQKYSSSAKELPVWLIGTFLLLHCEESVYRLNSNASEERSGADGIRQQKHLSTRVRSHSSQQDHFTCYILRHLRKILLLLAVPHNDDAVRACMTLAAIQPTTTAPVSDASMVEKWHQEEHGTIGIQICLTLEDLEKLNFVLQPSSGGGIDDPPIDYGQFLWNEIYRGAPVKPGASIPLGEVEHFIRQQLTNGYQKHMRPELALAKLSLSDTDSQPADKGRGYQKELTYTNLRGTTILLKPESTDSQNLHDLVISDCSDAHFYLLQPFEHVTISFCTGCTIVVGAVAGLLYILDCEKTQLTSPARRLLISNSSDVLSHIFTPSPPLLVGDNRNCQLAPYNTYYDGLRDDLLATGLAAVIMQDPSSSPTSTSSASWPLQCASNKWKLPVELSKLEIPQVDEDSSNIANDDAAMQTPILLPASEFNVLFVPLVSDSQQQTEESESGGPMESKYIQMLAKVLQLSPFRLPVEYERHVIGKADRMRDLQALMKTLSEEQRVRLEDELNRGFRDWLVTSGNLRQVLDLVHLERRGGM
mmetsp:Transcript_9332/g.14388  ORF Transcript_9332/g.14388 Transcript_9332/m.14388 type:complete len:667 (-) Transcript_9332:306-2306(-)|eukprot:CAMPEP_0178925702 /NCGR_PEP_ID=MMETSP0786-20121207/18069_1 /TAXON_ID=186022 /ORGANISM="Thalassionema frauenfeldii, Strain CCMP 1798" /LENGTH=666 /DNA_ID=CAMNT_0020600633 /DNA_START=59 /DNA_END=2059 /DNA_ORIENTATION=-